MQEKYELRDALRATVLHPGFWGDVVTRNHKATLPHVWQQCEAQGHIRNLDVASGRSDAAYAGGNDRDSDLHKVLEAAAYVLVQSGDGSWEARLDAVIAKLAAVQDGDGYLVSGVRARPELGRYSDLHRSHELYCMGHLIEAAVAHHQATGKQSCLQIARRCADHMDTTFGIGKLETTAGHQEVELALVRLYHATGERRYIELARYFIDIRGDPARVEREYSGKPIIESDRTPGRNRPPEYRQDHLPLIEQRYAVGHAVRAGYTYAAMADLAMACDSAPHALAATAIWDDIVHKKIYLTGGVGTHQHRDEGFGDPYLLPNDTGYCETCGGIALLLFSQRMGLLTGQARYADIVEKILLNHTLACTDLAGINFFYRNPLASDGSRSRRPWCDPACCPTNIVRIVPQIARLLVTTRPGGIDVDQFSNCSSTVSLGERTVRVTQQTHYPWSGDITLRVEPDQPLDMTLRVRIPAWARGEPMPGGLYAFGDQIRQSAGTPRLLLNGEPLGLTQLDHGYGVIDRTWRPGDTVAIQLPMPIRRVYADERVDACAGRVALMRGPLVYCLEQTDVASDVDTFSLSRDTELTAAHEDDLLGGVTVIRDAARTFAAVPYYTWNNRAPGKMQVWLNEA